jgi:hypothetical protein
VGFCQQKISAPALAPFEVNFWKESENPIDKEQDSHSKSKP